MTLQPHHLPSPVVVAPLPVDAAQQSSPMDPLTNLAGTVVAKLKSPKHEPEKIPTAVVVATELEHEGLRQQQQNQPDVTAETVDMSPPPIATLVSSNSDSSPAPRHPAENGTPKEDEEVDGHKDVDGAGTIESTDEGVNAQGDMTAVTVKSEVTVKDEEMAEAKEEEAPSQAVAPTLQPDVKQEGDADGTANAKAKDETSPPKPQKKGRRKASLAPKGGKKKAKRKSSPPASADEESRGATAPPKKMVPIKLAHKGKNFEPATQGEWVKEPYPTREFIMIDYYHPVPGVDKQALLGKLKSSRPPGALCISESDVRNRPAFEKLQSKLEIALRNVGTDAKSSHSPTPQPPSPSQPPSQVPSPHPDRPSNTNIDTDGQMGEDRSVPDAMDIDAQQVVSSPPTATRETDTDMVVEKPANLEGEELEGSQKETRPSTTTTTDAASPAPGEARKEDSSLENHKAPASGEVAGDAMDVDVAPKAGKRKKRKSSQEGKPVKKTRASASKNGQHGWIEVVDADADADAEEVDEEMGRAVGQAQWKQLGVDFSEKNVWGVDCYTRKNIFLSLPSRMTDDDKNQFIERVLLPTINRQPDDVAHDMTKSLETIIETGSEDQVECAQSIMSFVKKSHMNEWKIQPKGKGAICLMEGGLEENEFIVEYTGEIYPPWRWYEKVDAIKNMYKNMKQKMQLPDFCNIVMECHKDDDNGYDVMFVDAVHKGSYGSRLSHSCKPNCATVCTVANGKYTLAVYSLRRIEEGEELSFDYNATTDNIEEYRNAICLCGTSSCRGSFLHFVAPDMSTAPYFNEAHNLAHRMRILLRAGEEQVLQKDWDRLSGVGIKSSVLGGCQQWLIKFASLVVEYVNCEFDAAIAHLLDKGVTMEVAREEANGLFDSRIQNLVITLDKVKRVTQLEGTSEPPLLRLTPEQVIEGLWTQKQFSTRAQIAALLETASPKMPKEIQKKCVKILNRTVEGTDEVSKNFEELKHEFRAASSEPHDWMSATADLLNLYQHTKTWFRHSDEYRGCLSTPVEVRPVDVELSLAKKMDEEKKYRDTKRYAKTWVWGQLMYWYKHTIELPNMSLSADRRGVVTLPDIECIATKSNKKGHWYKDARTRQELLSTLATNPYKSWGARWPVSFRNRLHMYGTAMLDAAVGDVELSDVMKEYADVTSAPAPKRAARKTASKELQAASSTSTPSAQTQSPACEGKNAATVTVSPSAEKPSPTHNSHGTEPIPQEGTQEAAMERKDDSPVTKESSDAMNDFSDRTVSTDEDAVAGAAVAVAVGDKIEEESNRVDEGSKKQP